MGERRAGARVPGAWRAFSGSGAGAVTTRHQNSGGRRQNAGRQGGALSTEGAVAQERVHDLVGRRRLGGAAGKDLVQHTGKPAAQRAHLAHLVATRGLDWIH